jgi:hypothetical protein
LQEQPPGRRLKSSPEGTSEEERVLLQGFIDTHERFDAAAALAMLKEDVRVTMPPQRWCYEGRDALVPLMQSADSLGDWRLVATRATREPTAASYLRQTGDSEY